VSANESIPHALAGSEAGMPAPSADARIIQETPGLSLRSNFAWVLAGNVVFAGCQWGMIVALAKLGNTLMVGQFSLGLAIATPILMFTNLHLRTVQATDAQRLYCFGEYFRLRVLMTLAGLTVIAIVASLGNYGRGTVMVILAVALAKAVETLSDIHYGLFQLNDRLDQTGRSLMIRGSLSVVALGAGLYFTHDVFWGCAGLVVAWLAALLVFDVRRGRRFATRARPALPSRRQWTLVRLALPLGIVTTMAAVNLNMPRYFIHARMDDRQLGIYSAMAYATVAVTLVSDSLGHSVIPRLSRMYAAGRRGDFRALLGKLLGIAFALGLAGLALAHACGERLLAAVYGQEYAARSGVFTLLMTATAIQCVASVFTSGVTSARCFRIQVPLYAAMAGANALACAVWIPKLGLTGGAMGMIVAASVQLVLAAVILAFLILAPAKGAAGLAAPRVCADNWETGV
jgi:O-antigen/teichoic acid export membrane protein